MSIYDRLKKYEDEKYQKFQAKLVPNIDSNTIIGVRTPDMRSIAKEVFGTKEAEELFNELSLKYQHEKHKWIKGLCVCLYIIMSFVCFLSVLLVFR